MKILAIEASGGTAGCALAEDGKVLGEYEVNYGRTHSQTLVPMLDELCRMTQLDLESIDALAVTAGPGSFTGLRIGAATVKGITLALEKPVIAVSTLESLAFNLFGTESLVCPVMDARRQQVYTAVYEGNIRPAAISPAKGTPAADTAMCSANAAKPEDTGAGYLPCLLAPCALSAEQLAERLNGFGRPVIFLGDGVPVCGGVMDRLLTVPHLYAPGHLALQRAASTAILAGEIYAAQGEAALVSGDDFRPVYLRKPQAERQREQAEASGRLAAMAAGRFVKETRAAEAGSACGGASAPVRTADAGGTDTGLPRPSAEAGDDGD